MLEVFNQKKVIVIPWKGPLLSELIFDNPAIRDYGDFDILIQREDLAESKKIILEQGYNTFWKMTSEQEVKYIKNRHSYEFCHDELLDVELHWLITKKQYNINIPMLDFWKTSQKQVFLGTEINMPTKENVIIGIAAHHGGVECWLSYKLIVDWYYLLTKYEDADWDIIFYKVKKLGIRRILTVGMLICERFFDYQIPQKFNDFIIKKDRTISKRIEKHLLSDNKEIVKQSYLLVELRDNMLQKIKLIYDIMMLPSLMDDFHANSLPKPFKIFERPVRLINRFILKKEPALEEYSNRKHI